ncbi:MAG: hypothetical protein F6K03_12020 [Kamptonema sp. SIO4C4]|nr:hypothetical protein [Kamptonema sp. SIO4C4]
MPGSTSSQSCLETFHLTPETLEVSEEGIKVLRQYLWATQVLVRCKQSAVRVSAQTWAEING